LRSSFDHSQDDYKIEANQCPREMTFAHNHSLVKFTWQGHQNMFPKDLETLSLSPNTFSRNHISHFY